MGEISLIQHRPATATAHARGNTVVLFLARDSFNDHVKDYPEVLAHIYQVALAREKSNLELQHREFIAVDEDLLLI